MDEKNLSQIQEQSGNEPNVQEKESTETEKVEKPVREDPILFNFKLSIVHTVVFQLYTEGSPRAFLLNMASKKHLLPDGREVQFSLKTYERWVRIYRESNEDSSSLEFHARSDKGRSRKLTSVVMERIKQLVELAPSVEESSAYAVRRRLVSDKLLPNEDVVSIETIRRFIRDNNLRCAVAPNERIRRMFVMPNVGDMWQVDTCYYFKIYVKKALTWVYVQGIMDDHSRYIIAARCYIEDTASNFRKTLFSGIEHHHIPSMIVADNGGPYIDSELCAICKRLGISLVHTRAGDGASKGCVERFWRTLEGATMLDLVVEQPETVEDVQKIVDNWVADYNKKVNTGVKGKPLDRYLESIKRHPVRKPESVEWLKKQFLHSDTRCVRCSCISVNGTKFHVPDELVHRKKLQIYYNPDDIQGTIYAVANDTSYPLKEEDFEANSRIKRNTGGRKAQLRERAEAKEAAKLVSAETTPESSLTLDAKSVEIRRAESRFARRTSGTCFQDRAVTEDSDPDSEKSVSLIGALDFSAL